MVIESKMEKQNVAVGLLESVTLKQEPEDSSPEANDSEELADEKPAIEFIKFESEITDTRKDEQSCLDEEHMFKIEEIIKGEDCNHDCNKISSELIKESNTSKDIFPSVVISQAINLGDNIDDTKKLVCSTCGQVFLSYSELLKHGSESHVCGKTLKCNINLDSRIRKQRKEHTFTCSICSKSCNDKSNLIVHIRTHTNELPYKCNFCERSFRSKSNLNLHLRKHKGDHRSYMCDVCKKCFSYSSSLKIHARMHSGIKPFSCEVCNKSFARKSVRDNHRFVHSVTRPFPCTICKLSYRHKSNLERHMMGHERSHSSTLSDKTFGHDDNILHSEVHTGERPFSCSLCNKVFVRESNYDAHVRTHTGDRPHICEICSRSFGDKSVLKVHLRTHSGERPYICGKMPRTKPIYTPKEARKRWKEEDMERAIVAVRENKMGTLKASKTFNVPHTTLQTLNFIASAIEVEKTCNTPSQNPQPSTSSNEQSVHPSSPAPQQLQSTSKPVSPFEIAPVPITKRATNRGRKSASSCVITGTPYKQALMASMEASAFTKSKKKLKFDDNQERRNNQETSKAQKSEDEVAAMEPPLNDDSDFEMPIGDFPKDKDASCLFCDGLFKRRTLGHAASRINTVEFSKLMACCSTVVFIRISGPKT
ncbi:hypothetical protein C0J52_23417 [Blattella germanica]|nr:hypothetical protein C0J52_23417 [Blattella germanica]